MAAAPFSVQDFMKALADEVALRLQRQPAKTYDVTRSAPNGTKVAQNVSLPQIIAELTDAMKIVMSQNVVLIRQQSDMIQLYKIQSDLTAKHNELLSQHHDCTTALVGELEDTRKTWRRRQRKDEDDE